MKNDSIDFNFVNEKFCWFLLLVLSLFRILSESVVGRNSIIRGYRRAGNRKPRDMAGMRIQQAVMGDVDELEQDPEMTYDADFNKLDQTYNEHKNEMELKKEQLKYYVIKSRYFKSKQQPNFLTWAEKEQIRFLNKDDPDAWTPERLSESFPAVKDVIIKVLKANWTPSSMKRIEKHDENVRNNWKLYKNGEMKGLDAELQNHLKKFTNRQFDSSKNAYMQTKNDQIQFQFPVPKSKEFTQIITSCKKMTQKISSEKSQISMEKKQPLLIDDKLDKALIKVPKEYRKEEITFDELIKATGTLNTAKNDEMLLNVSTPNEEASLDSNIMPSNSVELTSSRVEDIANIKETTENKVIDLTSVDKNSNQIQKYASKKSGLTTSKKEILPKIQHRIQIPKRLHKKYAVYKLYDCFYDDKGIFMYRVPGLE